MTQIGKLITDFSPEGTAAQGTDCCTYKKLNEAAELDEEGVAVVFGEDESGDEDEVNDVVEDDDEDEDGVDTGEGDVIHARGVCIPYLIAFL